MTPLLFTPVPAATYSLARDFSYTDNSTNSTWSYRLDDSGELINGEESATTTALALQPSGATIAEGSDFTFTAAPGGARWYHQHFAVSAEPLRLTAVHQCRLYAPHVAAHASRAQRHGEVMAQRFVAVVV